MPITLTYNKLKALVRFQKPLTQVTLAELVEEASLFTSIPTNEIKLIFSGGVMKNLNASLSSYGINENSKIMVFGSKLPSPIRPSSSSSLSSSNTTNDPTLTSSFVPSLPIETNSVINTHSELQLIHTIDSIPMKVFKEIEVERNRFFSFECKAPEVEKLKLYLSEKLLQGLLSLDGILLDLNHSIAREHRKKAVNKIQALLDEIDKKYHSLTLN